MKTILIALSAVRGFKLEHYDKHMILGSVPGLRIRILRKEDVCDGGHLERRWLVQIAQRKTFGRWANSVNFEEEIWWSARKAYAMNTEHWAAPDFVRLFAWCRKVCRSGLFDFNSYFGTVSTPWFASAKQRKIRA